MDASENIVYYNGFWYSTHSPLGMLDHDFLDYRKRVLDQLTYDLRSLALLFDVIHVPRSHLLTFHTNVHWEVVQVYTESRDFKYFADNEIVLTSSLPYIDNYSDTERIVERVKDNSWSSQIDKAFVEKIKRVNAVKIDSGQEAKRDVDIFGEYIALRKMQDRRLGLALDEITKKASYQHIPFVHEIFIEEVLKSSEIDGANKAKIWKDTNTLYMESGCLDLSDTRRISLDSRVEATTARWDNCGMLRELYSPKFIQFLIEYQLGEKYLIRFLRADIEKVMEFRNVCIWRDFKSDIFQMFEILTIHQKIFPEKYAKFSNDDKMRAFKRHLIEIDSSAVSQMVADLMVIVAETQDPVTGKIVGVGKRFIAEKLIKWYSDKKLDEKIRSYREFWKELKHLLDCMAV